MKLKVKHVMDATITLTNIINRQCPMPQRGKFMIARMHMKLFPEWKVANDKHDELVKSYNTPDPVRAGEFIVPEDKLDEYKAAYAEIQNEEIDVDVQPIPLTALCPPNQDGLIESGEFIVLADLVTDNFS